MEEPQRQYKTLEKCSNEEIYNQIKESAMKSSIRDQAEGTLHEVKGKLKEVAGKLSDNPKLKVEGTVGKMTGKVQGKIGQVKKVLVS